MKHLRTLLSALLVSLLAGISGIGYAEDVDIYIRQATTLNEAVRPNILFMLDNSGSMNYPIRDDKTGTPLSQRRIDVLQQALTQMLTDVHNVNVGLARFAQLIDTKNKPPVNAPIMFPVFYIDANLKDVPGEKTQTTAGVSVRLANSTDDAEENLASGRVYLNHTDLQMVKLKTSDDFKGIKIEQPIDDAGLGAAVEWLGTSVRKVTGMGDKNKGVVRPSQAALVLGTDQNLFGTPQNQGDALIGLRFTNLAIPVGAHIEKAEIEFVSDQDYSYQTELDAVKLNVYGAANDGAASDASGVAFDRTVAGYLSNKNNFPRTPPVSWTLNSPLQQGQAFKTPDIKDILNTIVSRAPQKDPTTGEVTSAGWDENNSIVFLIQSDGDSPAKARGFFSKRDMYSPPILRLSWTIAETSREVISGKSTWNTIKKAYNVGTLDQTVEYAGTPATGPAGTKGYYFGYAPQIKVQDVSALQGAVTTAQQAFNDAKANTAVKQTDYTAKNTALTTAKAALSAPKSALTKANSQLTTANSQLTTAQKAVDTAQLNYDTAKQNPKTPQATLNSLLLKLTTAQTTRDTKQTAVTTAQGTVATAQVAFDQANAAVTAATASQQDALTALNSAKAAQTAAQTALTTAQQQLAAGKAVKEVYGQKTAVGVRFEQIPIPKGATILEAYITMTFQGEMANTDSVAQSKLANARSLPLKLNVYGEKTGNAATLGSADPKLSTRTKTNAKLEWPDVAPAAPGGIFKTPAANGPSSPDLSPILQELVIQDDWKSQNSMVFIFENADTTDFANKTAPGIGGFRKLVSLKDTTVTAGSVDPTNNLIKETDSSNTLAVNDSMAFYNRIAFANLPKLTVKYSVGLETVKGTSTDGDEQVVGLRFESVDIPRGAKIVTASIDFASDDTTSDPAALMIDAEDSDSAATFTAQPKNITTRKLTGQPIAWNPSAWDKGSTYTSVDLTPLVTKIVNRTGWCGGSSSLAFVVYKGNGTPYRMAKSYDNLPYLAPTLNIEYDISSVPKDTCIRQHYSGQLVADVDDAEEMYSGPDAGSVYLTSDTLELGYVTEARLVGFRFRDVPISKNSKVLSANLILTARRKSNDAKNAVVRFNIEGEKSPDAALFTSADTNLSSRKKTKAVTWESTSTPALSAWQQNFTYTSPDLTPIIQEIVSQDGWEAYNSMAFFLSGIGRRDASAFKAGPTTAAILRIQVEGYLGDGGDVMTVRRQLKKVVMSINIPSSTTPLVDGLYESAQYYRGGPVEYGRTRNNQSLYLVSHPGTYAGGTLNRPQDCTTTKPFEAVCASEEITGYPIYTSPISSPCQSNHIVLLTDGLANMNASADKIKSLMGSFQSACDVDFLDPEAADPSKPAKVTLGKQELCGIDLARFLHKTDNSNSVKENQTVSTHTIGFQLGTGWKTAYKDPDNGRRIKLEDGIYKYIDTGDVVAAYKDPNDGRRIKQEGSIYTYIDTGQKVAATLKPTFALTPDGYAEDKQETADNLHAVKYLKQMAKEGGGGFFQANSVDQLVAAFKSIVSQAMTTSTLFAAPSVSINRFNNLFHDDQVYYSLFKPDRNQRWQGNVKKFRICQGTEGTCQSGELLDAKGQPAVGANKYIAANAQSFWGTTPDGGVVTLGGAGAQVPPPGGRKIYTYLGDASPGINHDIPLATAKNKVDLSNTDLKTPIFGTDPADDFEKVINWINGQDVNDENGTGDTTSQRWSFADPLHSTPGIVVYGGEEGHQLTKLVVGTNDGLIRMINSDTGKEDWAFLPAELLSIQPDLMANQVGERIYGMDTTPTFWTVDTNNNVQIEPDKGDFVKMYMGMRRGGANIYALDITGTSKDAPGAAPKLMWVIKGNTPGEFERLGQTWSRPLPTHVKLKEGKKTVLLFGGGYHASQDKNFSTTDSQLGGGNAIFMVDAETGQRLWWASSDSKANLVLPDMKYPIPSDLLLKDTDGDDSTDRIYVGDLGGQVWRIDLIGLSTGQQAVGILFAKLGDSTATERRRFFYPPEMVRISDSQYSGSPAYDMVVILSGTRPDPLEQIVHNRFYALRDLTQGYLTDSKVPAILSGELFDATDDKIQTDDSNTRVRLVDELKVKRGWFINLQEAIGTKTAWVGEKGIAEPVVEHGKVYFTTYLPPSQSENACDFSEGKSRFYALDIVNANSVYNLDGSTDDKLTAGDRAKEIPGVATGVNKTATTDGKDHTGSIFNPNITPAEDKPLERFFWLQK